jgi:antitoxin (DNA-binding transcriptional repressor) of toxin-antitoxin stability system
VEAENKDTLYIAISYSYDGNMQVSVADAKNKLPELIKAVEDGEPVTICRRGVPVVDLVRTRASNGEKPKFGTMKGRIIINDPDWWKPMSDEEVDEFLDGRY